MFKAKMADAKVLKDMMGAISILVDEATFDLTPEGIKLRAMDPSRVAMVDFEWPKTVFDEYACGETMKMCINISEMLKLLRRTGKDESVELSLDEKTGKLKIAIRGNYSRTFSMPTLEALQYAYFGGHGGRGSHSQSQLQRESKEYHAGITGGYRGCLSGKRSCSNRGG